MFSNISRREGFAADSVADRIDPPRPVAAFMPPSLAPLGWGLAAVFAACAICTAETGFAAAARLRRMLDPLR